MAGQRFYPPQGTQRKRAGGLAHVVVCDVAAHQPSDGQVTLAFAFCFLLSVFVPNACPTVRVAVLHFAF
jgi:hypothetical protein